MRKPRPKSRKRSAGNGPAGSRQRTTSSFFNNALSTLPHILERGGIGRDENSAFKVKRLGVKPKELKLPDVGQFEELLKTVDTAGSRQSQHCADLVRFLAFSCCQISEAGEVRWSDVDTGKGEIRIQTAKRSKTSGAAIPRRWLNGLP